MSNKIKYVFFGSPRFARIILEKLIQEDLIPQAVVCNPDRLAGRKKILTSPAVKELIENKNLTQEVRVLQPEKLDSKFEIRNSEFEFDFFIVAAYAKIIPSDILSHAKIGTVGVHPSLLPKHRGASPIQTALLEQDTKTGVTLYLMDDKMDHGPILSQAETPITDTDTYLTLEERLATLGADLLVKTLPAFAQGKSQAQPQNHTQATFTKKLKTEEGFITENDLSEAISGNLEKAKIINAKIRALEVEPGTWTLKNGRRLKLISSKVIGGKLVLEKIQFDGKKVQKTESNP